MAKLPNQSIADRIDAVIIEDYPRPHLGASQLGAACVRSLVYSFRWASKKQINGKLNRIFSLGHATEDIIIDALKSIGIDHYGSQDKILGHKDHGGGSVDGVVANVPGFDSNEELLFEAKSMNHTMFLEVKRKGVQESKPVYYTQMQMYMGRLDLQFAMFVAMDKNNSELYIEIVPFDSDHFEEKCNVEIDVIDATFIGHFPKISNNPSWFQCKFCDFKDVCHDNGHVEMNCRTCEHSSPIDSGEWHCSKHSTLLTVDMQRKGCDSYEVGEIWGER